jgi:hypothetical protein
MLDTLLSLSIQQLIGGGNGIFCSTSHMASGFNMAASFFSKLGGMSQRLDARLAQEIPLPVLLGMWAINLADGFLLSLVVFMACLFNTAHSK